jgi:hypothetical protein
MGEIIAGKRAITADIDLRLCRFFGLSDSCLQASHRNRAPANGRVTPKDHSAEALSLSATHFPRAMPSAIAARMNQPLPPHMHPTRSFQGLILTLHQYWAQYGCLILQPYDMEVGAGTFHPATTLRALGPRRWNAAYVQPSRRPTDGRYGENPNRLQHYYQYQVLLKPSLCHRHRPEAARHPLRRGRLGKPDAGRLGPRLGSVVRRHGSQPVHLFPAGLRL